MTDLTGDIPPGLARALGDDIVVERELGGGGMSRVYLCHDRVHERRIPHPVIAAEGGHHAAQPLGPVAGAERLAAQRDAHDDEFDGVLGHRRIIGGAP